MGNNVSSCTRAFTFPVISHFLEIKIAHPTEEIYDHCLEMELDVGFMEERKPENSLFSRDVMYISKCKIAEPLSFQLSLVIEHPKYISF